MKSALAAAMLLALSATAASAQAPYPSQSMAPPTNGAPAYGRPAPTPEMRAARHAMRQACAAYVQSFCADAQTTGQRPMQCMRQHMSQLSPGCTQAIRAMRAARRTGAPQDGGPQDGGGSQD